MFTTNNNFHQQHSHKTEKFENHFQFRNNFLANLRKRAQFSKHSVSFMQFSEPCVIVTQSSESSQCRLDLHLFQARKFHVTYAFTRYQGNAMQRPFSVSALGSIYDVAHKKSITLWTKFTKLFVRKQITIDNFQNKTSSQSATQLAPVSWLYVVKYETPCRRDWLLIWDFLILEISWINPLRA
jgi:hypothetical protein